MADHRRTHEPRPAASEQLQRLHNRWSANALDSEVAEVLAQASIYLYETKHRS